MAPSFEDNQSEKKTIRHQIEVFITVLFILFYGEHTKGMPQFVFPKIFPESLQQIMMDINTQLVVFLSETLQIRVGNYVTAKQQYKDNM